MKSGLPSELWHTELTIESQEDSDVWHHFEIALHADPANAVAYARRIYAACRLAYQGTRDNHKPGGPQMLGTAIDELQRLLPEHLTMHLSTESISEARWRHLAVYKILVLPDSGQRIIPPSGRPGDNNPYTAHDPFEDRPVVADWEVIKRRREHPDSAQPAAEADAQ